MEKGWVEDHQVILLSDLLSVKTKVPRNDSLIIFKTVNMALFDALLVIMFIKKPKI